MNQADTPHPAASFAAQAPRAHSTRQQLMAAMIGNVLEYYDFIVYAFLAGTLARNFFHEVRRHRTQVIDVSVDQRMLTQQVHDSRNAA